MIKNKLQIYNLATGMLATFLLVALPMYLVEQVRLNDQIVASEKRVSDLKLSYQAKIDHELTQASDPGNITTGDLIANFAGWQTYSDPNLKFSFRYPADWQVVDQSINTLDPLDSNPRFTYKKVLAPPRFASVAGVNDTLGVYGVAISCKVDSTSAQTYVSILDPMGLRDSTTYFPSNLLYYISERGSGHFIGSNNGVLCMLQKSITDESKLTKDEDGQGMGIVSTFRFL